VNTSGLGSLVRYLKLWDCSSGAVTRSVGIEKRGSLVKTRLVLGRTIGKGSYKLIGVELNRRSIIVPDKCRGNAEKERAIYVFRERHGAILF